MCEDHSQDVPKSRARKGDERGLRNDCSVERKGSKCIDADVLMPKMLMQAQIEVETVRGKLASLTSEYME